MPLFLCPISFMAFSDQFDYFFSLFQSSSKMRRLSCIHLFFSVRCYKSTMKKFQIYTKYTVSYSLSRVKRGFTLVELLVTLAIAAIILAIGMPSFTSLMSSNAVSTASDRLADTLSYARSEAVSRISNVSVCASADGATCIGAGTDIDWSGRWLVFTDNDADGVIDVTVPADPDNDDEILKVFDVSGLSIQTAIGSDSHITYTAIGTADIDQTVSFVGNDGDVTLGRDVEVSLQGSLSSSKGASKPSSY